MADGNETTHLINRPANAPVHAQDLALDGGSQWEVVEQLIDAAPHKHKLLAQPLQALQAEAKQGVDVMSLSE